MVRKRGDSKLKPNEHSDAVYSLERRLLNIDQQLCGGIDVEEFHVIGSRVHYTMISRLFQLSALIYLDRVARGSPISSSKSQAYARDAFDTLRNHGVCERPLPMLLMSLQAERDEDRMLILGILASMTKDLPLSNLDMTERMIRRIWAQQDLHGVESTDALFVLNAVISANQTLPSFT